MEQPQKNIAKILLELRTSRGWTRKEAAEALEISESTYRDWEYGAEIRGEPYPKIVEVYNTTYERLFGVTIKEKSIQGELDEMIVKIQSIKSRIKED